MNKARWRKLLVGEFSWKRLVRSLLFIYGCLLVYAFVWSDRMLFPAPEPSYADTPDILKIPVTEGITLSAAYYANTNARFTVLYNHGNAVDLGHLRPLLAVYRRQGFSVFAYDYEGYGTSSGPRPSTRKVYRDADAVLRYLVEDAGVPLDRMIVHGRSVGGGPAVYLAQNHDVAGLILQSTFVTAFRALTRIPLCPFDKFRNIARIDAVDCPVLVLHGLEDATIPVWHGKKLYARAREPKRCAWLQGAGHDDLPWAARDAYWGAVRKFADKIDWEW